MKRISLLGLGRFHSRVWFATILCLAGALLGFAAVNLDIFEVGGADINLIIGAESSPNVTQGSSAAWGHGNTVVVMYDDFSGIVPSPPSFCGVSTSTDGGATFTRLPYKFNTGGACFGQPSVFYSVRAARWFASSLASRCGGSGVGLWTSPDGINWSNGACAFSSNNADLPSIWVDNNPGSPFYGWQYAAFNDFNLDGAPRVARSTDDGSTWSAPATIFVGFRRAWKLTGSLSADGIIYLQTLDEGGGGLGTMRQNFISRSTDGGATWTTTSQGASFLGPGRSAGVYFAGMYSTPVAGYWQDMGWGELGVGLNGVVHYAYTAGGPGDPGNILYIRSTDNGVTWSAPLKLNTDATTRAQWRASLSVNLSGNVFVSWYDERNTATDALERFGRASTDNGVTWGPDMALSDVIFPKPLQPDPSVQPDYVGLFHRSAYSNDGIGNVAYHTWTDGRVSIAGSPQQDLFFDKISFGCTIFSENFDGVVAPALPPGWSGGGDVPAITSTMFPDTALNDVFFTERTIVTFSELTSPTITLPATSASRLSYRNLFNTEPGFDGMVLEISISGGPFQDILSAGGSFVSGGYNSTLSTGFANPFPGRQAWSGLSGGTATAPAYINTVVNLPATASGQNVQLRWLLGSDSSVAPATNPGLRIDTLAITATNCPPTVVSAVSRKVHGAAGTFDINLPLTGTPGVECRTGAVAGAHQMVVTFAGTVTVGGASANTGVASFGVSGGVVTVNLTGVTNDVTTVVTLNSVSDGVNTGNVTIPIGVLLGDTNGDRFVNAGDALQTRNRSGQVTDASKFRSDVNADGFINSGDTTLVRSRAGTALP